MCGRVSGRLGAVLLLAAGPLGAQQRLLELEPIRVQKKLALVIGNTSYPKSPLKNPINDAKAMTTELRDLGFEVIEARDLGRRQLGQSIDQFAARLERGDLALFYFSGHGIQVQQENYLLPVDFEAASDADVAYEAYSASRVRDKMEESGARLRILILDACRNNPFRGRRSGGAGLAPMISSAEGTYIAYATSDNSVADDNPRETNGLFTKYLVAALRTPGLTMKEVFEKVKSDVYLASSRKQQPFAYDGVIGLYHFRPGPAVVSVAAAVGAALQVEMAYWTSLDRNDAEALRGYLSRYPGGQFAEIARRSIEKLNVPAAAIHPPVGVAVESRRSVAVVGFKNLSGRPDAAWLSTALSEMFISEMAAGARLRLISGENVSRMKTELTLSDADVYAAETLGRIKRNLGVDFLVLGSYVLLGEKAAARIRMDLRLQDAVSGELIASVVETGAEGDLFDLVTRSGSRLRDKLGLGPLAATEQESVRASLPASQAAARFYAEGLAKFRLFDAAAAKDLLEKAVAEDPRHSLAHAALAAAWWSLGYDTRAAEAAKKAFDLSQNLSREDRLTVEGRYRETIHQYDKAIDLYRALFSFYPDNLEYGLRLVSSQTAGGKAKEALQTVGSLRKLPASVSDDPRIDLVEADVVRRLSDYKGQQAAAARAASKAAGKGATLMVAAARMQEAMAYGNLSELDKATAAYGEALKIYASAGNRHALARIDMEMGNLLLARGRLDEARQKCETALAILKEMGALGDVATALTTLGRVQDARGDFGGAVRTYGEALALYREVGFRIGEATVLNNIAIALKHQGDFAGVRQRLEEVRTLARELGNRNMEAVSSNNLAVFLHEQGALEEAKKTQTRALEIYQEIGAKAGAGNSRYVLARLLIAEGNLSAARKNLEEALKVWAELNNKRSTAFARLHVAIIAIEEGRPAEAEPVARESAALFGTEKSTDSEAFSLSVLAQSLLAQGKVAAADEAASRALPLAGNNPQMRIQVSVTAGRVLAAAGKRDEAVKVLNAALEEATKSGLVVNQLELRLALGEIEMTADKSPAARARLEAVEKEAAAKGAGLVARKAARALGRTP